MNIFLDMYEKWLRIAHSNEQVTIVFKYLQNLVELSI